MILATSAIPLAVVRMRVKSSVKRKVEFNFKPLYLEPAYGVWTIALLFSFAAQYTPAFFIQDYAEQNQIMSADLASYLLPTLNAASIVGRTAPNFIADRIGGMNVLIPAISAAAILAYCWIAISSAAGCFVFAGLYGLCVGVMLSVPNFVTATLCPDPKVMGTRQGKCLSQAIM